MLNLRTLVLGCGKAYDVIGHTRYLHLISCFPKNKFCRCSIRMQLIKDEFSELQLSLHCKQELILICFF